MAKRGPKVIEMSKVPDYLFNLALKTESKLPPGTPPNNPIRQSAEGFLEAAVFSEELIKRERFDQLRGFVTGYGLSLK